MANKIEQQNKEGKSAEIFEFSENVFELEQEELFEKYSPSKRKKLKHLQNVRRRLDSYKERKWLKEHNWFDDDAYLE